jgi:hypothetical protein
MMAQEAKTEEKVKAAVAGSLMPDAFEEGTAPFLDDFRGVIKKARFVVNKYKNSEYDANMALALWIVPSDPDLEYDAAVPTQTYGAGSLSFYRPSNDGVNPLPVDCEVNWMDLETEQQLAGEGITFCPVDADGNAVKPGEAVHSSLSNRTGTFEFLQKSIEGGLPVERMRAFTTEITPDLGWTDVRFLEGCDAKFDRVPQNRGGTDGKGRPRTILVMTQFFGIKDVGGEDAGAGDEAAAAAAVEEGLTSRLEGMISDLISSKDEPVQKASALTLASKLGHRAGDAVQLIADDKWLGDESRPWSYEGGQLSAAAE